MDGQSGETKRGTPKLNAALKAAQMLFKPVEKGAINPAFKDRENPRKVNGTPYADLEDIVEATRPHLLANGIAMSHEPMENAPDGFVKVRTVMLHDSGEERGCVVQLPCVQKTPQAYLAAITYAKRGGWQALVAAVAKGEDDDGNTASGRTETTQRRDTQAPSAPQSAPRSPGTPRPAPKPAAQSGATFPPYGRSKGAPVAGASKQDLEFYRSGCLRSLADPAKSNFHAKEKALLAAIDDELSRHGSGPSQSNDEPPPPGDDDAPF